MTELADRLGLDPGPVGPVGLAELIGRAGAAGLTVAGPVQALAVRTILAELARRQPGRSVELRVPPWAAVQLGAGGLGPGAGPKHHRGTPPAVVETDPDTLLALATGRTSWTQALRQGRLDASGAHADLSGLFPLTDGLSTD
jgi:hypothetical protein